MWESIMNIINGHLMNAIHVHAIENIRMRLYQVVVISFCVRNVFCYYIYCQCVEHLAFCSQGALDCK